MTRATSAVCGQNERLDAHALGALPADEARALEQHLARCAECRDALEQIRASLAALDHWPTDVLRPLPTLWDKVARRVGVRAADARPSPWREPEWEQVAPGISCKLLATDTERGRVSMLVRLEPNTDYPPHTHAGVEELHLLQGELWIDDRKLFPGDYNRAEPGTSDARVWSETGCTCVLITSPADRLG